MAISGVQQCVVALPQQLDEVGLQLSRPRLVLCGHDDSALDAVVRPSLAVLVQTAADRFGLTHIECMGLDI